MKRSVTSSRIVRRVVAVSDLVTSADVPRLAGGRSVWRGHDVDDVGGHRRASSGTGGTPPTLAVIRDEIDAAVRTRTPVDDRERVAVAEFLTVLEHLGEDPFDEHANPVHVTASALIVGRRGLVLHRHKVLGTWVPPGGHIDHGETPWEAAVREANEETGLHVWLSDETPNLVHVDVHAGPRGHTHLDLRYLLDGDDADPRRRRGRAKRSSGAPGPRH